jgi:CBS domain-containing protein
MAMAFDLVGKAKRVRVYTSEDDRTGRTSTAHAVLDCLRRENAQGATLLRASSGFGATGELHTAGLVDIAPRLPVIVEWIDRPEVVARLLPRVKELVPHGLITVDDTEVVLHQPHPVRDVPAAMTAVDVMSRDVVSATKDTPIRRVFDDLLGKPFRAVPVVEDGAPIGIITSSDLVREGGLGVRLELVAILGRPELDDVLERLSQSSQVAADVMTRPPVTVEASTPLPEVAERMARLRLKRLPVVNDHGKLVGIVSRVDLLRAAAGGFEGEAPATRELGLARSTPLARVMRRDFPLVRPETPLPEVFQAVVATRLNRALVVDAEHRVVGLVTDAELLERITPSLRSGALRSLMSRLPFAHPDAEEAASDRHARARTAADLMTRDVAVARDDTTVSDAIGLMLKGSHKVLAVTDPSGRLVGLVDRADLLHGLVPG